MDYLIYMLFGAISFGASIIGSICGIGGGILIKPILDAFGVLSIATISFLSGLTVLSMSSYSVIKGKLSNESEIDNKVGTPLAIGAAMGGIFGKFLFQFLMTYFSDKDKIGAIQSLCLLVITLGSLMYTINKDKIKTYKVENYFICIMIGLTLGVFSSFLGIGGGPINLVVLSFFFSMGTKVAAQNSIYIILYSQTASLVNTLVTKTVPEFDIFLLILMVACGVFGGAIGRKINKKIDTMVVNKLFIILMIFIMIICIYNILRFI